MALRARNVSGAFEKRPPGPEKQRRQRHSVLCDTVSNITMVKKLVFIADITRAMIG